MLVPENTRRDKIENYLDHRSNPYLIIYTECPMKLAVVS
jgi:hypothetical protein